VRDSEGISPVRPVAAIKRFLLLLVVSACFLLQNATAQEPTNTFQWDTVDLPLPESGEKNPGLAGAFSGVSNDALIIAGGTNFPELPPWKGGKKVWYDDLLVLMNNGGAYDWVNSGLKLPYPAAHGVSITLPEGLLCIGGDNELGILREIFLLTWDKEKSELINTSVGLLPEGFEVTGGAMISGYIYLTGIVANSNGFLRINWEELLKTGNGEWETLPSCPGPPRRLMSYAAQSNGDHTNLYLFGGRSSIGTETTILYDAYEYDTKQDQWKPITSNPAFNAGMAAPAIAIGASGILLFGGDDGTLFQERYGLERAIAKEADPDKRDSLSQTLEASFIAHTGFSRTIMSYNTITGTFSILGEIPELAPVVTTAVTWNNKLWLPSGEIFPGVRSPTLLVADPIRLTKGFGALNYGVIGVYFVVLILIGVYFSARQRSTQDYFSGGGRIPWWAAGLSIFGTALSAVTFMAIPAKTFATDWSYLLYNFSILIATPVVVMVYIRRFVQLNLVTAYEYLEKRFNVTVRWLGSFSFILFQVGRIGIVLYLPAIALALVTGIDISSCILVMGLISMFYTYIGGIEAVIWTDVIQVIVLLGGAILSIVVIVFSLDQSLFSAIQEASDRDKFHVLNFGFDWTAPTFWVVVVGGFFANLVTYGSDQTMVQRYLTASSERNAVKSSWTNAIMVIPATLLFFSVGTALFLFYVTFPEKLDPFAKDNDAIFPWYIIQNLPAGVSGFLIAGVFSAAMSTLSSSMNSIAASFTNDFYLRVNPKTPARRSLQVAKIATLVSGLLGTLFALWMATAAITSLWDTFFKVLGLFTGGLGGLFLLGLITKRANSAGAIIGLIASSAVQYVVVNYTDLHLFLYAGIGMVSCFVIGYLSSILVGSSDRKTL